MTEEEEKVILNLKDFMYRVDNKYKLNKTNSKILKDILNLIDKQQEEIERLKNAEEYSKLGKETLLDTIHKQEKEIEELKKPKYIMNFETGSVTKIDNDFISKDKVLKAIGYEENNEEYERLKQDNEKLLAILDTLYSEVCRLEDIEDKKVEVAVNFIEEKRDKYWEKKIRDKIKELEDYKKTLTHTKENEDVYLPQSYVIKQFKSLLEEN